MTFKWTVLYDGDSLIDFEFIIDMKSVGKLSIQVMHNMPLSISNVNA